MHERKIKSGRDIALYIMKYIVEIDRVESHTLRSVVSKESWKCPPRNQVKINFDGAYEASAFKSTSSIVARDRERNILYQRSMVHERVASAFTAEAITCCNAIHLGLDMGWLSVIIEGDSLSVIKKSNESKPDRSAICAYMHDIRRMGGLFPEISFAYAP